MLVSDLIAQLQIILESDGDLQCYFIKKNLMGDLLEPPSLVVWAITKQWIKQTQGELDYFNEGDQIVLL